ncbi:hypothetical protein FOZ62_010944 [Perkinsus olseni]|uniref:Uncharacterized protein n=1 Tax=Perkinsus olseni TaxID=32597 RepID=A0A7J6NW57_PEROL|nr:hypothetical protein FOZ62_010944 [Perkinsus olseni]
MPTVLYLVAAVVATAAFEVDRLEVDWSPPMAGLPFYLTVFGTGFERYDDRVLLIEYGRGCGIGLLPTPNALKYFPQCRIASCKRESFGKCGMATRSVSGWLSPSTVSGWAAVPCGNPGSQHDKLFCGPITLNLSTSYQVCACDFSVRSSCADWGDFSLTVRRSSTVNETANVTVGGPLVGQQYETPAGQAIDISYTGVNLRDGDRIFIGSGICSLGASQSVSVSVASARSSQSTSTVEVWEGVLATAAGEFVICWCADGDYRGSGCVLDTNFNVEVGRLLVAGPYAGENNVRLKIGVPGSLVVYGRGLKGTDRVRVLADSGGGCGSGDTPVTSVHLAARDVGSDDRVEFWSQVRIPAAGSFLLCWCGYYTCLEYSKFTVLAGTVTVVGPQPNQLWSLSVTLPTNVTILATGNLFENIESEIRFAPLSSQGCGSTDVLLFPETVRNSRGRHDRVAVDGSWASWDGIIFGRAGKFRVCWCGYSCSTVEDFSVDCGLVTVAGPEVAEFAQREVARRPFELVVRSSSNVFSALRDRVMVVPNTTKCGTTDFYGKAFAPEAAASTGTEEVFRGVLIEAVGMWNVCWCGYGANCTEISSFAPLAATVRTAEAAGNDVFCMVGSGDCRVAARSSGGRLSAVSDRIWLVRLGTNSHCGFASHDYDRWRDGPMAASLTPEQSGLTEEEVADLSELSFHLPTPKSAGEWRLCYCQGFGVCALPSDFANQVGILVVAGASTGGDSMAVQHLCYFGSRCMVKISGIGLSIGDTLKIVNTTNFLGCPNTTETIGRSAFDLNFDYVGVSSDSLVEWILPSEGGSVSLHYDLGLVKDTSFGEVMVCHCRVSEECSSTGRLALRGVIRRSEEIECSQGSGLCEFGLVSRSEISVADKVVAIPSEMECGEDEIRQVMAGELVVRGAIMSIRLDETLLATARALTVVVEVGEDGGNLVCAATSEEQLDTPTWDAVMDCYGILPTCVGTGRRPDRILAERSAQVHLQLDSGAISVGEVVRVWCVDTSTTCCVSPNDRSGLMVSVEEAPSGIDDNFEAREGEPFVMPVAVGYDANASVKIVGGEMCSSSVEEMVSGVKCASGAFGSCEFESPTRQITIRKVGVFTACLCERFYNDGNECAFWEVVGSIRAIGASADFFGRTRAAPGESFTVVVEGLGLSTGNRIQLTRGGDCDGEVVYDGLGDGPRVVNDTYQEFEVPAVVMEEVELQVCWCFESNSGACRKHVGVVDVKTEVDCELGGWIVVGSCSRSCGGGVLSRRRQIIRQASGGGVECPPAADLQGEVSCNEQECPMARLDSAVTSPTRVEVGTPFRVLIRGSDLDPSRDRLMIVSYRGETVTAAVSPCGRSDGVRVNGARCDQPGSTSAAILCGDGVQSMVVNTLGRFALCLCDLVTCTSISHYRGFPTVGGWIEVVEEDSPSGDGGGILARPEIFVVAACGLVLTVASYFGYVKWEKYRKVKRALYRVGDLTPTDFAEEYYQTRPAAVQWGPGVGYYPGGPGFDPGLGHYSVPVSPPLALPAPVEERIPPPPSPRRLWGPQKMIQNGPIGGPGELQSVERSEAAVGGSAGSDKSRESGLKGHSPPRFGSEEKHVKNGGNAAAGSLLLAVVMSCFLTPLAVAVFLSAPCLLAPGDAMEVEVAAEGSLDGSAAAVAVFLVFCIGLAGGVLFGGGKDGIKGGRSGSRTSGHRDERREVVPVRVRKHIEKKSSGKGGADQVYWSPLSEEPPLRSVGESTDFEMILHGESSFVMC